MCVYAYISKKNRVGRSVLKYFFSNFFYSKFEEDALFAQSISVIGSDSGQ